MAPIRGLPITEAGRRHRRNCLVNCGSLLEALAKSHVDVVLHGHEHETQEASYSSFVAGSGPVRVIGAGSVTGNHGLSGASLADATFNVLVLSPDRSAAVRRLVWDRSEWKVDEQFTLVDPPALRQSRLRRMWPDIKGDVTAAIIKNTEFTRDRDIVVHWFLYDWVEPGPHVEWEVSNSTGKLDDMVRIRIRGSGEHEIELSVKPRRVDDHKWSIEWEVPVEFRRQRVHIQTVYRWRGGGILTRSEMSAVAQGKPGPYRREGLEYSSIETTKPLASFDLYLTLPHEYAPDHVEVRVRQGDAEVARDNIELRSYLKELTRGRYSLRVPFPRIGRQYAIVWEPVDDDRAIEGKEYAVAFRDASLQRGSRLLTSFASAFETTPLHDRATFALYVRPENGVRLQRTALLRPDQASGISVAPPPGSVALGKDPSPMTQAWRGEPVFVVPGDNPDAISALGLVEGEVAMIAVPLRFSLDSNTLPPWAVVRVGVLDEDGLEFVRDPGRRWSLISAAAMRLMIDFMIGRLDSSP